MRHRVLYNESMLKPGTPQAFILDQRRALGLSVRKLAEAVNCSPSSISQIMRGTLVPGVDLAYRLFQTLQFTGFMRAECVSEWADDSYAQAERWNRVRDGLGPEGEK